MELKNQQKMQKNKPNQFELIFLILPQLPACFRLQNALLSHAINLAWTLVGAKNAPLNAFFLLVRADLIRWLIDITVLPPRLCMTITANLYLFKSLWSFCCCGLGL